jgi:hypothetical protein
MNLVGIDGALFQLITHESVLDKDWNASSSILFELSSFAYPDPNLIEDSEASRL